MELIASRRTPRATTATQVGSWGVRRQRSDSDQSSSTSSDIQVSHSPAPAVVDDESLSLSLPVVSANRPASDPPGPRIDAPTIESRPVKAHIRDGRILVVDISPERLGGLVAGRYRRSRAVASKPSPSPGVLNATDERDNGEGPNARGTYSKEYTLRHPEYQWIHRGQGRYLPFEQGSKDSPTTVSTAPQMSRPIRPTTTDLDAIVNLAAVDPPAFQETTVQDESVKPALARADTQTSITSNGEVQRRKRRAGHEILQDSLSPVPVYGLRHRPSFQPTPLTPSERPVFQRPARRVKSLPGAFSAGRKANRAVIFSDSEADSASDHDSNSVDMAINTNEQSRFAGQNSDHDMVDADDERSYRRDYVNAHPEQTFYHVGAGWYKRGHKVKRARTFRNRDPNDNIVLNPDGSYTFDPSKTIHSSQLAKFPGQEFHHIGNGWYKAGPHPASKRTNITTPTIAPQSFTGSNMGDDAESIERFRQTVSKEYTLQHPDVEWMHRGNGRYIAKELYTQESTPTSALTSSFESRSTKDEPTFDKAYVDSHPLESFYHAGNGRYKRSQRTSLKLNAGPLPLDQPKSKPTASSDGDDPDTLYDKAYVDAHPHLEFHHRGQGRYKRGPRPAKPATQSASQTTDDEDDGDDGDGGSLVDTAYVEAHPNETFHHKGQGRWARGMPPLGSSNKTAVRGPGARTRTDLDRTMGLEDEDSVNEHGERPPGLTALVLRSEGPEKWPQIAWHYRGGGKWSRMTKSQWDQKNSGGKELTVASFSRYKPRRAARAAVRDDATEVDDDEDEDDDEEDEVDADDRDRIDQPVVKRRRRMLRYANHPQQDDVQRLSQSSSDEPTPRPPLLAPEDDVLAPEDLPDLYRGSFSPMDPDEDDVAGRLYRAQFRPLNVDALVKSLTKHNPSVRPLENLLAISQNTQEAMQSLQDEYLELERITAPHSRIPRKAAKGGRLPAPHQVFEDRREAELYDYNYDPRKVGFQDPIAQRIMRDAEGRELRKRRGRHALEPNTTVPGWDFGEGPDLASKRQSRQPSRFIGIATSQTSRRRGVPLERNNTATTTSSNIRVGVASMSPERSATPQTASDKLAASLAAAASFQPAATGRWAGHVPKRIRELQRENSVTSVRSDGRSNGNASSATATPDQTSAAAPVAEKRKGRPPGSKNHHKRRDAGIKKGPRKPKASGSERPDLSDDAYAMSPAARAISNPRLWIDTMYGEDFDTSTIWKSALGVDMEE